MGENIDPHVAVLTFPFSSHPMCLFMVVRRLIVSAPNVMFSFFGTAESNGRIFGGNIDKGLENMKAYDVDDGLPENYVDEGLENIELFMGATPENFKKGIEVAVAERGRKITCVMSDAFFWFAADMAEEIGVPWLAVWIAGDSSLSIHFYTDLIRSTIGVGPNAIAGREDETLDFIPGMSFFPIRDLPDGVILGNLESAIACMLHRMGQTLPRATAVVINNFEELNPKIIKDLKLKFQKCLSVAPFTLNYPPQSDPDTTGCLSWLDKQKPSSVAYISFGTVGRLPRHELEALAEGLEASGIPFLWSLKDKMKELLPDSFLQKTRERGLIVPWTPQLRVLQHEAVGVHITHCGWNSVVESILAGVPMIGRPILADNPVNGRFISNVWGIGLRLDNGVFTKDGVIKGIDRVLFNEEGKKMMEKVQALKEIAEKATELNGSATRNFKTLSEMDKMKEQLPDTFLQRTRERGLIVPWTPQLRVLQHKAVGVFITHCGWNSVVESILAGVPMIGRPIFGDHPLNGRFVSDVWEIGIRIDNGVFTKDGVIKGIDRVLFNEEGKKMMEKVQTLKEVAKMATELNGSTTRNFKTLLELVSTSS